MITRPKSRALRRDLTGYAFMLPMLIGIAAFTVYPLIATVVTSFTNSGRTADAQFVGTENFEYVLTDNTFWAAFSNTIYMGIGVILIGMPLSLIIATLIYNLPFLQGLFKALFFVPNITSAVAAAIAFLYVFYPSDEGWVNGFIGVFGFDAQRWFSDPDLSRLSAVLLGVWHGIGFQILIWLAGLTSVPPELHEAAETDGAGPLRRFWHITIPSLRPIILFILVTSTIDAFKRFADVFQIGGIDGAPAGTLSTLMLYVYRTGFQLFDFGRGSAASIVIFLMIMAVTALNLMLMRNRKDAK